jgi:hypothetical protein
VLSALYDYLQFHHFRSSALSLGFATLPKFILTKHRGIVNRARVADERPTQHHVRIAFDRFAVAPDDSLGEMIDGRERLTVTSLDPFEGLRSQPTSRNSVRADQQALANVVHRFGDGFT